MADFTSGSTDPAITPDRGAGAWNSERVTADTVAFQALFYNYIGHAYVLIGDDATRHMAHYMGNTGREYTIDLRGMVDEVPSARLLYLSERSGAQSYVQNLPAGNHTFTSRRAVNGYNQKSESWNWYFAIGGYSVWGKGRAIVRMNAAGQKGFEMDFEYKFFDRYNWDHGKSVTLFGVTITDEFMGRMHRQGIAREFNCRGSITERVTWGAPVSVAVGGGGGGR